MTELKVNSNQAGALMPALFVGHGSPMNLINTNVYTETFARLGKVLPAPEAILSISAHWVSPNAEVDSSVKPKQIFDFYGFPNELYHIHYTPDGAPSLAEEIAQKSEGVIATQSWGLDHGTWSVLHFMYPEQNIPSFQLSLKQNLTPQEHLRTARQLKELRQKGVLIIGSGNIVHNLRQINWNVNASPHPWAVEFEEMVLTTIQSDSLSTEGMIDKIFSSSLMSLAHPTVEHLLPLIYFLGVRESNESIQIEVRGIQNAAISMATMSVGC